MEMHNATKTKTQTWKLNMFVANLDDVIKNMQIWATKNISTKSKWPSADIKVIETLISPYNFLRYSQQIEEISRGGSDMIIPYNFKMSAQPARKNNKLDPSSLGTSLEYLKFQMTSANA